LVDGTPNTIGADTGVVALFAWMVIGAIL